MKHLTVLLILVVCAFLFNTLNANAQASLDEEDDTWYEDCWVCPIIKLITDTQEKIMEKSFDFIANEIKQVGYTILIITVVFYAARLLMPFGLTKDEFSGTKTGTKEVVNELFTRLFLMLFVLGMIESTDVFKYFYDAVFSTGARAGKAFVDVAATNLVPESYDVQCSDNVNPDNASDGTTQAQRTLFCQITIMQKIMGVGMKVGVNSMKKLLGTEKDLVSTWDNIVDLADRSELPQAILMFAAGATLWVMYFGIVLVIPFKIIDATFKIAILLIGAPIFMLAYVFPATRTIATKAIRVICADAFSLPVFAVMIAMILGMLVFIFEAEGISQQEIAEYELETHIADPIFWYLFGIASIGFYILSKAAGIAEKTIDLAGGFGIGDVGTNVFNNLGQKAAQYRNNVLKGISNIGMRP